MTPKEQYENMSDEELIERYNDSEDYLLETKIVILEELKKRGIKFKEEINQKLEKVEKDKISEEKFRKKIEIKGKIKKLLKRILISICLVYIVLVARACIYKKIHPPIKSPVIAKRIYEGEYKGRIIEKYPNVTLKPEQVRLEILKSIKSKKKRVHEKYKNRIVTEYFDNKGRIVFKSDEDQTNYKVESRMSKSSSESYQLIMPIEEGFVYDETGRVIKKIYISGSFPYNVREITEESRFTFLKQKSNGKGVTITEIEYPDNNRKKEVEEIISNSFQIYSKTERIYKNDVLLRESTFDDSESDDGFIMATVEKKYNEKGELIYKTVERKDKTNDYKSFTEMDFEKDEIVTKYYKGNDVFATVTENLVGSLETIEKKEMVMGEKIKKTYKNKVKAIVKRQKVGEPVKIVDVIEYVPKEIREKNNEKYHGWAIDNTRYIFNEKGELIYKIFGIKASIFSYLYDDLKKSFDINTIEKGMFHESFFQTNYEDSEYQAYLFKIYKIQKYDLVNNKIIDMRILDSDEINEKVFKEEINITSLKIDENNLEKISEKEIDKNEIKTLEELLNGCKYE